ncbi:MAG: hypothetical protein JEY94_18245 [Melioribacteraceae bacterium]|nr:hypothetical protein [Melioribacteraceae bacterium]
MKSGQIFWGVLFITIGTLFLLVKNDYLVSDFYFVWDIWPLIFIFWGLAVMVKGTIIKPFLSGLFGLFTGLMIFGFTIRATCDTDLYFDDNDSSFSTFQDNYNNSFKEAKFNLETAASSVYFKSSTTELVNIKARGERGDYSFNTTTYDSSAVVDLELEQKHFNLLDANISGKLEIKLNQKPIWDLKLNIGAAKGRFDLSDYKIRNMNLNTGAADIKIKLGDDYPKTLLNVDMGAASLEINIPKSSGCKLKGDWALLIKNLDGFEKHGSDYYVTENYEDAENKIVIDIDGGISSLNIKRY